jgi:hypothetical protein
MDETTKKWASDLFGGSLRCKTHINLPVKMDLDKTTADEWIRVISQNSNKKTVGELSLRVLKKLPKIAKNSKITDEYILMSSFLHVMIDRENITIEHVEGNNEADFVKNQYDFDYQISTKDIRKVFEKENEQVIFSVTTHSSATLPPCPDCKGKGFFRCEDCKGSGREQYVDGNFADGEERKKTGPCSHCYGQGKIACEKCNGTGKQPIYANTYQTVRRFEDRKTVLIYDYLSASWEGGLNNNKWDMLCNDMDDWDMRQYNYNWDMLYNDNRYHPLIKIIKIWYNMDNIELENCIEKLYKNSKEIIIDRKDEAIQPIFSETRNKCNILEGKDYHKKRAYSFWKEQELVKGQLGCSLAKHYAIPAIKLSFTDTIENRERIIYIVEDLREDIEGMVCLFESLPEVSFIRSLFI